MAQFGLKKQGRQWGLFRGSELLSGSSGTDTGEPPGRPRGADGQKDLTPAEPPMPYDYDNDTEYRNVRSVLEEAKHHPPLESPDKQRQREQAQAEVEAALAAFEAKHGRPGAVRWDAAAEGELQNIMLALDRLLKHVGLSLHHL